MGDRLKNNTKWSSKVDQLRLDLVDLLADVAVDGVNGSMDGYKIKRLKKLRDKLNTVIEEYEQMETVEDDSSNSVEGDEE